MGSLTRDTLTEVKCRQEQNLETGEVWASASTTNGCGCGRECCCSAGLKKGNDVAERGIEGGREGGSRVDEDVTASK